jgi:purine-binding chemotaxis protein CheW
MQANQHSQATIHPLHPDAQREVLVFGLGAEEYAVDIGLVQELRGYEAVTALANAPAYFKGVVNLRGVIVPLVDLRLRFGQREVGYDATTVVVVLNLAQHTVGIVVDRVADVVTLGAGQVKPAPQCGGAIDAAYLLGLATLDERLLILVDIGAMLAGAGIVPAALLAA